SSWSCPSRSGRGSRRSIRAVRPGRCCSRRLAAGTAWSTRSTRPPTIRPPPATTSRKSLRRCLVQSVGAYRAGQYPAVVRHQHAEQLAGEQVTAAPATADLGQRVEREALPILRRSRVQRVRWQLRDHDAGPALPDDRGLLVRGGLIRFCLVRLCLVRLRLLLDHGGTAWRVEAALRVVRSGEAYLGELDLERRLVGAGGEDLRPQRYVLLGVDGEGHPTDQ